MKRYFYTDPLAAAWMAKHYALKFKNWRWNDLFFQFTPVNGVSKDAATDRLYIHPDSLHLLEPQVNDYIEYYNCFMGTIWRVEYGLCLVNETSLANGPEEESHYATLERVAPADVDKIIQRNGVPFMWPESEET